MDIHFNKVIPIPLAGIQHSDKSIWGNSFSLKKGEKVMLNASSGKGKTTFTHTLAGIRKDFNGSIRFDQVEINSIPPEDWAIIRRRSEEHTSELQSRPHLVCRLLLEKKKIL